MEKVKANGGAGLRKDSNETVQKDSKETGLGIHLTGSDARGRLLLDGE